MATNQAPPRLQNPAQRPISFLLDDTSSGFGSADALALYIPPEDLERTDPSRVNVTQTLGGAFADSFGAGMPTISIAGHTGWRRDQSGLDGEDRFMALRDQIFDQWHARRAAAVRQGNDPSRVQLIFSDSLDRFSVVVAPMVFKLKRSRSRPLLLQYQIQMAVLGDVGTYGQSAGSAARKLPSVDILTTLGLGTLAASLNALQKYANNIQSFVDRSIAGPVREFMDTTQAVLNRVQSAISSVGGATASLLSVAKMLTRSAMNIFHTMAAVANLPAYIRGSLMAVATEYSNIFCVLSNALRARSLYEDFGPIYGASNCSSTSGGRPVSPFLQSNTFSSVVPAPVPPLVSVSPQANAAMVTMANTDPVSSPLTNPLIGKAASDVASGIVLA